MVVKDLFQFFKNFIHSIYVKNRKRNDQDFWINATPDEWYDEMLGMREMLDYYGNISIPAIVGSRAPFFLLGGNEYFGTLKNNTFQWDSSWPTRTFMNPGLWPYTLDYLSQQV